MFQNNYKTSTGIQFKLDFKFHQKTSLCNIMNRTMILIATIFDYHQQKSQKLVSFLSRSLNQIKPSLFNFMWWCRKSTNSHNFIWFEIPRGEEIVQQLSSISSFCLFYHKINRSIIGNVSSNFNIGNFSLRPEHWMDFWGTKCRHHFKNGNSRRKSEGEFEENLGVKWCNLRAFWLDKWLRAGKIFDIFSR